MNPIHPVNPVKPVDPTCDKPEHTQRAAKCLQVLAHSTRILILHALRNGERTVGDIESEVGGSQPNVSQHLRVMRDRGIVKTRKEANKVFYSTADPRVYAILDAVREVFCGEE